MPLHLSFLRQHFPHALATALSEAVQNYSCFALPQWLRLRRSRLVWLTDFTSRDYTIQDATWNSQNAVPATGSVSGADIDDSRFLFEHSPRRVTADVQHVCDICDC